MCQSVCYGLSSLLQNAQVVQVPISESPGTSARCGQNHSAANPLCARDIREARSCYTCMQQAPHSVACMPRCLQHRLMHVHMSRFLQPLNLDLERLLAPQVPLKLERRSNYNGPSRMSPSNPKLLQAFQNILWLNTSAFLCLSPFPLSQTQAELFGNYKNPSSQPQEV